MRIFRRAVLPVVLAALAAACTKADTSLVAPDTAKCHVSAVAPTTDFNSQGGSGSIAVSAARDCTWSVSVDAAWVSISGNSTGQGEASVAFSVAANPVPASRVAALTVSDAQLHLTQEPAPCHFNLSRTGDTIGATGGPLSVSVTTLTGCAWSAASNAGWLTITSGASAAATGTVELTAAPNSGGARAGTLNVAGQTYTVTQSAAGGTAPPPPGSPLPPGTPSPTPVDVTGRVQNLSGDCPTLRFDVGGWTLVTDRRTDFKKVECREVTNGMFVHATGKTQPDGTVDADKIEKLHDEEN